MKLEYEETPVNNKKHFKIFNKKELDMEATQERQDEINKLKENAL